MYYHIHYYLKKKNQGSFNDFKNSRVSGFISLINVPFSALPGWWRCDLQHICGHWVTLDAVCPLFSICANPWISNGGNSWWVFYPNSDRFSFFLLDWRDKNAEWDGLDKREFWSKGVTPKI